MVENKISEEHAEDLALEQAQEDYYNKKHEVEDE